MGEGAPAAKSRFQAFNTKSYSHGVRWKVFKNNSRSVRADIASERDVLHFLARLIPPTDDKIPAHPPGR